LDSGTQDIENRLKNDAWVHGGVASAWFSVVFPGGLPKRIGYFPLLVLYRRSEENYLRTSP
jgi:hypothetical protein